MPDGPGRWPGCRRICASGVLWRPLGHRLCGGCGFAGAGTGLGPNHFRRLRRGDEIGDHRTGPRVQGVVELSARRSTVASGTMLDRGEVVGRSGSPHGVNGVHLSTRIDGEYVDPESQLGCRDTDITRALRLVTPPGPYARQRAHRDPGRDVRPDPYRPSPRRRDGVCSQPISTGCCSCPPAIHGRKEHVSSHPPPNVWR